MGQHSDKARQALLNAAEELFARHGIDAVSNRSITEHAGTANHSAIAYHFGGRDELIYELLHRHLATMSIRRTELMAELGDEFDLRDIIACRILPFIEQLDSLPVPSWRARFLDQARTVPSVAAVLAEMVIETEASSFEDVGALMRKSIGDVSPEVLRARSGIMGQIVLGVCAEYEARLEDGFAQGTWADVGYFLIDSTVGMISAPVTPRDERFIPPSTPSLV
ncbi:TetR/AcrR family transcriptional regulator [Leifsonia sp. A12D58]|uniref:TetR/AcrR family transcriptional regulator n=1 Tax=Leifsonia sp. A12D58 TaxID=3397674 RepID=UPI0039E05090